MSRSVLLEEYICTKCKQILDLNCDERSPRRIMWCTEQDTYCKKCAREYFDKIVCSNQRPCICGCVDDVFYDPFHTNLDIEALFDKFFPKDFQAVRRLERQMTHSIQFSIQ